MNQRPGWPVRVYMLRSSWPSPKPQMVPTRFITASPNKRQEELVRKLFGAEVETLVGTIWGFGDEQELRNMYTRTGQPGLWLIAGGLAQCRIGSKHLALQIKAIEEGLLPRDVGPRR